MSEPVLKFENLTKEYRLGLIGHGTLYRDLQSWWATSVRGKEDPNSLVTANHDQRAEKDHFLALDDVSFNVGAGERIAIIGKNGAGKSTLLKILSRITSPTKGCIRVRGRIGSLLEVGTGFHGELTGRENAYLNGSILGMKKWEIDKKLDEIIDFSGVEKFIDTPVKRYSSGMSVRLGFAVAAHLDPEILVVDEVLAVGDAEFQKKAIGKMEQVSNEEGRTILFVSHNMASVRKLCQTGVVLERGRIKMRGKIDECIQHYFKSDDTAIPLVEFGDKEQINTSILSVNSIRSSEPPFSTEVNGFWNFTITYKLKREIKGLYFALTLRTFSGDEPLYSSNSYDSIGYLSQKEGTYTINVKIKNILSSNYYGVSLAAFNTEFGCLFSQIGFATLTVEDNGSRDRDKIGHIYYTPQIAYLADWELLE